jgi:hypothetical protein
VASKKELVEQKERKRDEQRKVKGSLESVWKQTDTDAYLALRQSFSARQQQRLSSYFETTEQAEERIRKTSPEKLKKSHVPIPSSVEGEFDRLKEDMKSWPRKEVNWTDKAREYKIRRSSDQVIPPNAGQILKEYLKVTDYYWTFNLSPRCARAQKPLKTA